MNDQLLKRRMAVKKLLVAALAAIMLMSSFVLASCGMAAGDYSVKATVTGKATGTIQIEVVPAE